MKPNYALKATIISRYGSQVRFDQEVKISELRLSRLIYCRSMATVEERRIISEKLGVPEIEIFPAN